MSELKSWEERISTGEVVGRDPRKMTPEELVALGHRRLSPMQIIRARCLDCCAGQVQEVRYCTARKCPSWPYRMGKNPFREQVELSDDEKARRAALLQGARDARRVPVEEGGDE